MDEIDRGRRRALQLAGLVIVALPLSALAAKNDARRRSVKYRDTPEGDQRCANCRQFVPGATPDALGGCKLIPKDNEISPNGYCVAWLAMA